MDKYTQYSDEQLIGMSRAGDADIIEFLMEKYKPMVRKKANAMYLIGGENEDLIQEGMIGLFKALRDYKEERGGGFAGFADLCISRQLYSAIEASNRKKNQPLNTYVSMSLAIGADGIEVEDFLMDNATNPEQLVIEQEYRRAFRAELESKLSKMEQEVLSLYLKGNNYTQIAAVMGKEPKSIDNALQRIRQKIRLMGEKAGE